MVRRRSSDGGGRRSGDPVPHAKSTCLLTSESRLADVTAELYSTCVHREVFSQAPVFIPNGHGFPADFGITGLRHDEDVELSPRCPETVDTRPMPQHNSSVCLSRQAASRPRSEADRRPLGHLRERFLATSSVESVGCSGSGDEDDGETPRLLRATKEDATQPDTNTRPTTRMASLQRDITNGQRRAVAEETNWCTEKMELTSRRSSTITLQTKGSVWRQGVNSNDGGE